MLPDRCELQDLASSIWGKLATRFGALAYRVATGRTDPPSASLWLDRQRLMHGAEP